MSRVHSRHVFAALVALTGGLLTAASPVHADTVRRCSLDPITGDEKCTITWAPVAPESRDLGGGGGDGARLPLRWSRVQVFFGNLGTSNGGCVPYTSPAGDVVVPSEFLTTLVNTDTGAQVSYAYECVSPGGVLPVPPPPPPSQAEFVEAARGVLRLEPQLNPRPAIGGLTGLDTWLWCTDPGEVPVSVALRGWTAAASMHAVVFSWKITGTEAATARRSESRDGVTGCGSAPANDSDGGGAAAMWMPETKGAYSIGMSATWVGTWTLSYGGVPTGTFVLGPFDFDGLPVAYPVGEYVGVLTDGRGR